MYLYSASIPPLTAVIAQSASSADPTMTPWLQYGILGLIIVGILYLKVIVPGWIYQAEIARVTKLEQQVKDMTEAHAKILADKDAETEAVRTAKDAEIARLRDLAENRTIPLLERALVLVERAEVTWEGPSQFRGAGSGRPPGQGL